MDKVYLIGNGYIAGYITEMFSHRYKFIGISRSKKKNCDINISLDISMDNTELQNLLECNSVLIYLAAPQQKGVTDTTLRNFLSSINKQNISKIIYISTSGVYGDKKDKIVNERSELNPITDRAKRRVNAENQIKESNLKYTILRVPGIYGKNRLPLKRIEERLPLIKKEICRHTNLIHAEDLANIVIKCINNSESDDSIINVSDGTPIKTTEYYLNIYDAMKIEYPKFIDYHEANSVYDEKRRSFINESRILDVSLMNKIFPNVIKFKDVIDGIEDCLK
tara:strand:- start:153 stop:992 length:840 start_codon:yes stop_codon:yes gene_type:complete